MKTMQEVRTSFTFRLALEEIKQVSAQLIHLTEEVSELNEAIETTQSLIEKKRKQVGALKKKVKNKKRALGKLRRSRSALVPQRSLQDINRASEDVDTTFATEDVSLTMSMESPISRKRKRFAGIWDNYEIRLQRAEKRARLGNGEEDSKENISDIHYL